MSYIDINIPNLTLENLSSQLVQKAFQDAMADNEIEWHNNREELFDFYVSQQTDKDEYCKDYFNIETDPLKDPDYPHNLILSQCNITSKLIDKKAKNYIQQPVRLIDGRADKGYDTLLLDAGIKSQSKVIDRMTWLLGDNCTVIVADANTKKLRLDCPVYYRPVFANGDNKNPIGVIYSIGMMKNSKGEEVEGWAYWDAERYIVFEGGTWNIIKEEVNPHGCFNVLFTHRMKPIISHWTKDAQDLVDTNRDINIALTSINNAIRYMGFPVPVGNGIDPKEAVNIKFRFDKLIAIAPGMGENPVSMELLHPNVDWTGLINVIKFRIEFLAMTWNVDIRWDISGTLASGIALKILSIDDLEDRNEMAELHEEYFEIPLFEKIKIISTKIEWLSEIRGTKLTLDWPEEEFIESPAEKRQRLDTEMKYNMTNPIDELKKDNPDLSDEDAVKQYLRNIAVNKRSQTKELTFESLMAALQPTDKEMEDLLGADEAEPTELEQGDQGGEGTDKAGLLEGNKSEE
jgi:hypothetical protein